ncbi:MAG: DDE-type integrase/transposase/recombinase [Inhella sp.]
MNTLTMALPIQDPASQRRQRLSITLLALIAVALLAGLMTGSNGFAPLQFWQELQGEQAALILGEIRAPRSLGHQLQIDFGTVRVPVGDELLKVHLFVATLGHSRRTYVALFLHERQSAWLQGAEGAFRHFGGTPREVLVDNARALVNEHDAQTREVVFNERFHAFCRYWGVTPRACAPYRARTKGKDERGVGYAKRNAIAGHRFDSAGRP